MAVQQPEVAAVSAQQTFPADEKIAPQTQSAATDAEAGIGNDNDAKSLDKKSNDESDVEYDTKEKQYGVEKIRAITSAWSWTALILTYALIHTASYAHAMQQQMNSNLAPYVTSSFRRHGLTATTGIVANLMSGVSQVPFARILNIFGRMEGYLLAHVLCCFGLILLSVCNNVEMYAAAQVFWSVGSGGIGYIHTVLMSDTTTLRNRMLIYTLNSTAYIGTSFAGPAVAQLFLEHSSWRWGFGTFAIIFPFFGIAMCVHLFVNLRKAKAKNLVPESPLSSRNWRESAVYYVVEFDCLGMLLLVAGFSLLLLPFSIRSYAPNGWTTPYIIAMIIVGFLLLVGFVIWEKMFAAVPMVPWNNLRDRTVLGAAGVAGVLFLSFACWDSYFSSYLQVVHNQSVSRAGFILNIYNIASCTWGPIVGLLIRQTKHYKWVACCFIPIACLSTGLLIYFRHPDTHIRYIIMCQILKACSAGSIIICEQLAVMSVVSHNEITIMLAVIGLASSVGRSIGRAISGGIWTNQLPGLLLKYLPEDEKVNAAIIYGDITEQLARPWGSPARDAIIHAYGDVQRHMVIAGAAFMPLALGCVLLWKNVNLTKFKQTEGKVF
ncbi:siderophore iron transporter mirB [Plectosphaerella plurivora]|uniref:Siderophore iron transporter mirB n=1 Tax=Plectosphaerella plurivora TaxID=936078 RepID=A0A9P9A984_9PEZI|nr:siderophore iron transporter mirB [Plectosphaerella plurivora]